MEERVMTLAGECYQRNKPHQGCYRCWSRNPGSVQIDDACVPVAVLRVRDTEAGTERPLVIYQEMKCPVRVSPHLEEAIFFGLSQHDSEGNPSQRVASALIGRFGLSQSVVSRRFQQRSRKALEAFESRSLKEKDIIALIIDGQYLAKHQMVICLVIDADGHKIPLGFVQAITENTEAINGLLQDLIRRDLGFSKGLLCVVDGAKGAHKALQEVLGEFVVVKRAYTLPGYETAREALLEVHK